jgi:hypothetical protein
VVDMRDDGEIADQADVGHAPVISIAGVAVR